MFCLPGRRIVACILLKLSLKMFLITYVKGTKPKPWGCSLRGFRIFFFRPTLYCCCWYRQYVSGHRCNVWSLLSKNLDFNLTAVWQFRHENSSGRITCEIMKENLLRRWEQEWDSKNYAKNTALLYFFKCLVFFDKQLVHGKLTLRSMIFKDHHCAPFL